MFLPISFNLDNIDLESQIIDSKYLRYELATKLVDECMKMVKKDYKKGESIKTTKDIGKIIHNEKLSEIFNRVFIEQYDIYTFKNKENISTFPYSETFKTLLAQLGELNRNFIRNIHDKFVVLDIDKTIFTNSPKDKNSKLKDIFEGIISDVLNALISNKRNIYQALVYKTSLLRLSAI